jgi:hypothetical protein
VTPTLGESLYKIEETVEFSQPAALVAAVELAIFRDRDGERQQLQLQFWLATLAVEGKGDPIQFHRWILLAGRKLALLNNEAVREADMRTVLIQGLPDDIFIDFKTSLHNHASNSKTFEDVFEILKVFSGSKSAKPKIDDLIRLCARQYVKPVPAGVFVARPAPRAPLGQAATLQPCFDFAKGKCLRGSGCKFDHTSTSSVAVPIVQLSCTHCLKKGHAVENCFAKYPEKRPTRGKAPLSSKRAQPGSSRAANFLLNIRQNVEELLLENDTQDESTAEIFAFKVVPAQGVSPPLLAPSVRAHRAASACDSIHNGASMIHLPPLKMASTNTMGRYRLGDVPAIPRRWGPKAAGLTTGMFVRSNNSGVTHCVSCLYNGVSVDCSFCRRSWDRYRVSTSSLGYVAQDATTISGFIRDDRYQIQTGHFSIKCTFLN